MTNIYVLMPVKNEEGRYLQACLNNLGLAFNTWIYDDHSTDRSAYIAREEFGCNVIRRPDDVPSFIEDESAFRGDFWRQFVDQSGVTEEDWILALDADEFLSNGALAYNNLLALTSGDDVTYAIKKHEIFKVVGNEAYKRMDGYWDRVFTPRFFKFKKDYKWPDGKMGCGCTPKYAIKKEIRVLRDPSIMHMGYAVRSDRQEKYQRYIDKPGHNLDHIKSIISPSMKLKKISWVPPYDLWGNIVDG